MPNWCQNRLTVEGPRPRLDDLRDEASLTRDDGKVIAFQIGNIVLEPPPGDPRRIASRTHEGGWDWHAWRVTNWGSKWDVCDVALKEDGERLRYEFDSAWAPPGEGIRRISLAYPDLQFTLTWFEWGMGVYGQAEMRDGELTEVLDGEVGRGDFEYDDQDEVEVIDPELREFTQAHGFKFYA